MFLGGGDLGLNEHRRAKNLVLFSQVEAQCAETSKRCAFLAHSALLPRAGPAVDLVGLAHQRRNFFVQAPSRGDFDAAPVLAHRTLLPCVGAALSSVALVTHVPRAIVSRGRGALPAAVLIFRASYADSALARSQAQFLRKDHHCNVKNPSRYLRGSRPLKGTTLRAGPKLAGCNPQRVLPGGRSIFAEDVEAERRCQSLPQRDEKQQ